MSDLPPLSIAELMPGHEDNAWLLDLPTELSLGDFDAALAEFIGFMPDPPTCAHNSAHTSDQDQECVERVAKVEGCEIAFESTTEAVPNPTTCPFHTPLRLTFPPAHFLRTGFLQTTWTRKM